MTAPKFEGIDFDAIITFNGSYCIADDVEIFKNPIYTETVHKIISNATSIGRPIALASIDKIGANGCDQDLEDYFKIAHEPVPLESEFEDLSNSEIYQIISGGRKKEYSSLLQRVTGAEITAWWARAVDIIPINGSKARGIQKTLKYFNLKKNRHLFLVMEIMISPYYSRLDSVLLWAMLRQK